MSLTQAYLFYVFLLTGILIGLIFDIFRILRKSFKTSDFVTIIQDIIFFIISSSLILYTVFKFNNGEIRSFVLIGLISGICIYLLIFSKIFIKINVEIINFIKKIIKRIITIILYPFNLLWNLIRKIFLKPISFIFINFKKSIGNYFRNMSKIKNKKIFQYKKLKKATNKEGF